MLKFAAVITGAGLNPKMYPQLSEIPIKVFDRKNNLFREKNLEFSEPLFKRREDSLLRFSCFLDENENKLDFPDEIQIKLHEGFICIYLWSIPCVLMRI